LWNRIKDSGAYLGERVRRWESVEHKHGIILLDATQLIVHPNVEDLEGAGRRTSGERLDGIAGLGIGYTNKLSAHK
jgi:hypothetical protein